MLVTYVGPYDEVEATLDRKPVYIRHGESIEVSDEQAHLLLDQEANWSGDRPKAKRVGASSLPLPPANAVPPADELTVVQLREQLDARGVPVPSHAKRADLVKLVEEPPPPTDPAATGDTN